MISAIRSPTCYRDNTKRASKENVIEKAKGKKDFKKSFTSIILRVG